MRRTTRHGVIALAAVLAIGAAVAVQSTVAAWTDPAHISATASAGRWTNVCQVMSSAGVATTKPCTVVSLRGRDNGDGRPAGQRTAQMYATFTFGNLAAGEYVLFTVDLRTATGLPANWSTWTTPNRGFGLGNLTAQPGSLCSALPNLTARAPVWGGSGTDVYFVYWEDASGKQRGCV